MNSFLKTAGKLVVISLVGALGFQNDSLAQASPSNKTENKLKRAPNAVTATDSKAQLADQLITELELEKAFDKNFSNSEGFFKEPPKDPNPGVQAKIHELYASALKEFQQKKPLLKTQGLADVKVQIQKDFTEDELKYLVVLCKYPVYKKLKSFLESDKYGEFLGKPFMEQRAPMVKLKNQVKELKASSVGK